jgi:asparagine synthetase B (glutamine-hydrolysing)
MHGCNRSCRVFSTARFYNHAQLREGLEQRGHIYTSHTDYRNNSASLSKSVVSISCTNIEGDFGIAIWDADAND